MRDDVKTDIIYASEEVEHTLNDEFITEALRKARTRELELLKEKILELHSHFNAPLKIFDIGIGDGHVPINFGKEVFAKIETYIGIDNSQREVNQCIKNIKGAELENFVNVFEFDATNLNDEIFNQKLPLPFHAILCTYFTAGNFRPDEIKLEENELGKIIKYPVEVLRPNKKFQKVFSEAYKMLAVGGKLILGSTYFNSPTTQKKQEEFYQKCGMTVITTEQDEFTATREGFWSERFTDDKLFTYLNWIPREDISIIPLDSDNFARMIVITKTV